MSNTTGATSASYTVASVDASHAGSYDCAVTNSCRLALSNPAVLTVGILCADVAAAKACPD